MKNTRAKAKKVSGKIENLPYGYATKVVKMLASKGISANRQLVMDIKRKKLESHDLTIPVLKAIKKVQLLHERKQLKLKQIRKA